MIVFIGTLTCGVGALRGRSDGSSFSTWMICSSPCRPSGACAGPGVGAGRGTGIGAEAGAGVGAGVGIAPVSPSKYPFSFAPGDDGSCSSGRAGITAACRPPSGLWEKEMEKMSEVLLLPLAPRRLPA